MITFFIFYSGMQHLYKNDTRICSSSSSSYCNVISLWSHDDVINWKHFPRYWPFCGEFTGHRWIPRTKASDAELWIFSLICLWTNNWANNGNACDLRPHRLRYDVTVMLILWIGSVWFITDWSPCLFEGLNHLPLVPHICVSELGQHWFG